MAWWDQRRFTGDSYGDFPLPLPAGCAKSLEKISIDSIVHPAPGLRLTECNRMTDPALPYMKGVQDGDADAPARLIDLFQGRIYAFLRRLAGSDSDAAPSGNRDPWPRNKQRWRYSNISFVLYWRRRPCE